MLKKTLAGAVFAGGLTASSAFAAQTFNFTVAAGQPSAALPSLALVCKFFIPEVNKRIKDAKLDVTINWKVAYAGSLLKPYQMLDGIKDGLADVGFVPTIFFPDKLPLEHPKRRLALLRKKIRDRPALPPLDLVVAVEQVEPQFLGHGASHGGFARAHESDEVEIDVRHAHPSAQATASPPSWK